MFYRGHSFLCVLTLPRTGNRNRCYPVQEGAGGDTPLSPSLYHYTRTGGKMQLFPPPFQNLKGVT